VTVIGTLNPQHITAVRVLIILILSVPFSPLSIPNGRYSH